VSDSTSAREATFVQGMALLPPGVLGVMLTGMLAALASTLDTHLNWGSSYLANDLYARIWSQEIRGRDASPRTQVWVARLGNVLLVAIGTAWIPMLGSIQEAWKATLVLGAGIGVVTVLRWLWWRITAWGELAALAASFAFAPFALALMDSEVSRMLGGAAVGVLAGVGVSLLGPDTAPETLRRFAERVRPPGFWGAHVEGGRRALRRALVDTAAASVSLFAFLLAGLRLLAPPPAGASVAFTVALFALAAVALVLWIPALRDTAR
jgi:Na+/proline symporter